MEYTITPGKIFWGFKINFKEGRQEESSPFEVLWGAGESWPQGQGRVRSLDFLLFKFFQGCHQVL